MNVINLGEMSTEELIDTYSGIIKELKQRGVIRTNNVIGELGEYLAISFYNSNSNLPNLSSAPIGTKNIDAISRRGDRYSIKSTCKNSTGVFYGLQPKGASEEDKQKFEYVIICRFDSDYKLVNIFEMGWDTFLANKRWHSRMNAWNLSLSKKLIDQCKRVY